MDKKVTISVILLMCISRQDVDAFEDEDIVIDEKRGLQLPPQNTGFFKQFNKCGTVNTKGRRKRSIYREKKRINATKNNGDDYILNGDDVDDYWYPWVGKLQYNENYKVWTPSSAFAKYDWRRKCTISLISSRHALTAKHCFYLRHKNGYDKTWTDISPDDLRILFGNDEGYLISRLDPFGEIQTEETLIRNIKKLHIPPQIDGREHDIAMMEFDDVEFTRRFRPICLPIHGMPVNVYYTLAGYGYAGRDTTGERFYVDQLQETWAHVKSPYLKPIHAQTLDVGDGETLTLTPWDPATRGKTNHFHLLVNKARQRAACQGDSGGGLMYQYPDSKKMYIMGTLISSGGSFNRDCDLTGQKYDFYMVANKVTFFLEWIVEKMKPPAEQENYCLHQDCKRSHSTNMITNRTWIIDYGTPRLEAPCASYFEGNYVCPVDLKGDRHVKMSPEIPNNGNYGPTLEKEKWRFCDVCSGDPDWASTNYLDEFTAGSFSSKPVAAPNTMQFEEAVHPALLPNPNYDSQLPYESLCDVFAEDSNHVYCPTSSLKHADHICILSEHICDGYDDCPDGWDESPHHCIGKCDLFTQYQYPWYLYPEIKGHYTETIQKTPMDCFDKCQSEPACNHFNWFGISSRHYDKAATCVTMSKYNLPATHDDQHVETTSISETYVIRGPRECPGLADARNTKCEPTNGIPYRTGIFLIQAFNGQYLENNAKFSSQTFEDVTKKTTFFSTNGLSSSKTTEWILHVYGSNQDLYGNYFKIVSGYGQSASYKERFLTLVKSGDGAKIRLLTELTPDQTPDKSQRWYMKYTRPKRGDLEVKIYSMLENSQTKYFFTFPYTKDFGNSEYHIYLGLGAHIDHSVKSKLEVNSEDLQGKSTMRQAFRLLECNYYLDSGEENRGLIRKAPNASDHAYLEGLFEEAFHNDKGFYLPDSGTVIGTDGKLYYTRPDASEVVHAGKIFKKLFGLSNARFYQMRKQAEKNNDYTMHYISETMSKSTSIFDYAGKMRIKPKAFGIMFNTWKSLSEANKNDLLCNADSCNEDLRDKFYQFIVWKRDEKRFLEI